MADVVPFRGILYNPEKVGDVAKVTAPPYDVISPDLQEELYKRHPNNIVRLILGRTSPQDRPGSDRYSRAGDELRKWIDEGVLVRDPKPALYVYAQTYEVQGIRRTRKGFIALSRLEEFGKGRVHAHEKTLSGPKADRLRLMEACRANLSCIFSLYSEPEGVEPEKRLGALVDSCMDTEPLIEVTDDDGVENMLWRVTDPEIIKRISSSMEGKTLFIADGHHRYETAVNYMRLMRERKKDFTGREPFNYVMMYFSDIDDKGLVVMPTHRVVHGLKGFDAGAMLEALKDFFEIDAIAFDSGSEKEAREELYRRMDALAPEATVFGLYIRGRDAYYLLRLKRDASGNDLLGESVPEVFRDLDVTVLHSLVLERILNITAEAQRKQENLFYVKGRDRALEECRNRHAQLVFLMNPTKIEQVKKVAEAGLVMPQKSTYFYPKLLSGLVINPLDMDESVTLPEEL